MSDYRQIYSRCHSYGSTDAIAIPVTLSSDAATYVDLIGKLDTGSTFCVFERIHADILNLDLASGLKQRIATATGVFHAYGHLLTLAAFDYEWDTMVYFAEHESFRLNILGRVGYLDHLRVGIVDYEQLLYCGLYDEP